MQEESISLYQKHGTTDKVYHAQLKPEGDGWVLTMQNGKRGGTLTPRAKFEAPVSYVLAKKEYDKLVRSKISDGYSEGTAGMVFQGTSLEERFTGNVPQHYNEITEEEVDTYVSSPDWVLQEKWDGRRFQLQRKGAEVQGSNKKALRVPVSDVIASSLACVADEGDLLLDSELMGADLAVVFDVLVVNGVDIRNQPLNERLAHLERIKAKIEAAGVPGLMVVHTVRTVEEKRKHLAALRENAREGGMFKRIDGEYTSGRPSSGGNALKFPFAFRATFRAGKKKTAKRSIEVFGTDGDKMVALGHCTVPSNYPIPAEGALVDIEYKYCYPGGSLCQPRYKGERDDVDLGDCDISRLHYKETPQGASDEDDDSDA